MKSKLLKGGMALTLLLLGAAAHAATTTSEGPAMGAANGRTTTQTVISYPGSYFEIGDWIWGCVGKSGICMIIITDTRKNPKSAQRYELLPEQGDAIEVELDPDGQAIRASFSRITVDESGQYPVFYGE